MGKCPCCHCGSPEHWDSSCKYANKKKAVNVRVFYSSLDPEELLDEEDYDRAEHEANGLSNSDTSELGQEEDCEEGNESDF